MDLLNLYIAEFRALHVNRTGGRVAPHKPVLLLSIIDLVESGHIYSNKIYLDDVLQKHFKETWKRHVKKDSPFRCSITYPFYHLSGDKFWHLIPSYEYVEQREYTSIISLQKNFSCAEIDQDLIDVLKDSYARKILREELIKGYL